MMVTAKGGEAAFLFAKNNSLSRISPYYIK